MIPTFIIDPPVLIFIGLFAGRFVPKGWQGSLLKTRAFFAGSVMALGFIALAAYGYVKAPDWMFGYLLPAESVPGWMAIYGFALDYVLFLGGFFLYANLRGIHPALGYLAILLALVASFLVVMPVMEAYQTIATYEDFHGGKGGIPLNESVIGKNTLVPGIILLVVGVILFMWSRRQKVS